ncbi:MAG: glutaredoxin family protein [Halobacteriales archaeon]|nr:glutaredoxin family protein [Halobacteriales archaeon]
MRRQVGLEAYRRLTLLGSVAGAALFGAGLVALVQFQAAVLAVLLMVLGMLAALATAALDIRGAPQAVPPSLVLFTRTECALCDEARALLDAMRGEAMFDVWEVDVDAHPDLRQAYGDSVPVGMTQGRVLFRGHLDEAAVRQAMDRGNAG